MSAVPALALFFLVELVSEWPLGLHQWKEWPGPDLGQWCPFVWGSILTSVMLPVSGSCIWLIIWLSCGFLLLFFVHYCVFIWCTKATSAHLPAVSLERLLITKWTPLFPGLNTLTGVPKKKNNPLTPRSHLYRGSMNMPQNTKTCVGPFVSLGMHHTTRDYNIS